MYILRTVDPYDIPRQVPLGFRINTYQYDYFIFVQHSGKSDKIIKPLFFAPYTGYTQQDVFAV